MIRWLAKEAADRGNFGKHGTAIVTAKQERLTPDLLPLERPSAKS